MIFLQTLCSESLFYCPRLDSRPKYHKYQTTAGFGTLFRRLAMEIAATDIGGNAWGTYSNEIRAVMRMDAQSMDTGAAVKREIFVAAT